MPKQRITKEMVVEAAFEIVKTGGMEQITVKTIAEKIGCSVQPIYSYCKNMEGLRQNVTERVNRFVREYVCSNIDMKDPFHSTGKAYIRLAKKEPHLFKIFILHQRNGISSLDDFYNSETSEEIPITLANKFNISISQAKQFHLNMLIYTIGIGTIFSVTTPGISVDEIFMKQEEAYHAFMRLALEGNDNEKTSIF